MAKVNQIIAVEKGVKAKTHSVISELYKTIQKDELFDGFYKQYDPKDDEGDTKPPQSKRVQFIGTEVLKSVERSFTELMKITARKDWSNCEARADLMAPDGTALVQNVPVTYLLFLEKQMTDFRTFVHKMPELDPGETWKADKESGLWKTDEIKTQSTSKEQVPVVLYAATPEHPAQTQLIVKDVVVGFWRSTRHSGAIPAPEKKDLLEKVDALLECIKMAREQANAVEEVESPDVGNAIFQYLMPQE